MRMAILYVCTGRYSIFWKDFFASCEKYFLPKHEKHYFVFTDDNVAYENSKRVHRIEQKNLGWPLIALKRYHIFEPLEQKLARQFDFACFFNANTRFVRTINDDDYLPTREQGLVLHSHPGLYWKPPVLLPYERRKASAAYIPYWSGNHYFCGGLHGGYVEQWLDMIRCIRKSTDEDLKNNIVAIWHDDSHLNCYARHKPHRLLHPGFATPDGRNLPFPRMIRLVDKRSVGGHDFMRGVSEQKAKTLKERFVFRPSFPKAPAEGEQPLVLARLLGGLGNQMFIYAAAYALAQRLGAELNIDSGALQSDKIRSYELHRFGLMDPQWRIPKGGDTVVNMWGKLQKRLGRPAPWSCLKCPPAYTPELKQASGSCYLTGYWQSPKYFDACAKDIRSLFTAPLSETPVTKELQAYVASGPTVAVHLRRGDYTNPQNLAKHGILPLEYYEAARSHIEMKAPGCQYLVFSDDPDAAAQLFQHWPHCKIAPRQDHMDDLMLMRACRHAIIANSSFSWWGAWLGYTEGQIVVAPRQWFAPEAEAPFLIDDLFPQHWTVL